MKRKITNLAHAREARAPLCGVGEMKEPQSLYSMVYDLPSEPQAREKLAQNTAELQRRRAYRTLVLTVALGAAGLYVAGAVYALVMI